MIDFEKQRKNGHTKESIGKEERKRKKNGNMKHQHTQKANTENNNNNDKENFQLYHFAPIPHRPLTCLPPPG